MPHFNSAGNYTGHYDGSSEWDGHSYDAAGRETTYTDYSSDGYQITNTTTRGFDGDGQMMKESFAATCPSCVPQSPSVAYYIRSSLLGGQVVATVNDQGQRQWSYVYANGELIASHTDQWSMPVQWRHIAPSGSGEWRTYPNFGADGITERIEVDPVGADVGTDDPYVGGGEANNGEQNGDLTSRLADAADFSRCNLDGIRMPCAIVLKNSDAVERARPAVVTLRFRNQSNPNDVRYRLGLLRALPDGGQGYVPLGARFDEGNYFSVSLAGDALGIGRIHAASVQSLGSVTDGPQKTGVEYLPLVDDGYAKKGEDQIRSVIASLLQNERCRRAFEIVGLQTINQTVENGIVIGASTWLSDPSTKGTTGIVEGARQAYWKQFNSYSARGGTISQFPGEPNPFTNPGDRRPRMFLARSAFEPGWLKETIIHEFIHAGGQPAIPSRIAHDLYWYAWYDFLQDACK